MGGDQPVLAVWERIADLHPQRLSFIVQQVPGSHPLYKDTPPLTPRMCPMPDDVLSPAAFDLIPTSLYSVNTH
jgi:hypothetical protein